MNPPRNAAILGQGIGVAPFILGEGDSAFLPVISDRDIDSSSECPDQQNMKLAGCLVPLS